MRQLKINIAKLASPEHMCHLRFPFGVNTSPGILILEIFHLVHRHGGPWINGRLRLLYKLHQFSIGKEKSFLLNVTTCVKCEGRKFIHLTAGFSVCSGGLVYL